MKIPFGKPLIYKTDIESIKKVLKTGILVHGKKTLKFELEFKNFTKSKYSISTSSCTSAMHLFYFTNKIGPSDEVIVPSQTHLATVHAVELVGAKPVFVDSNFIDGNININEIEKKITKKTKVITVVHYLGIPVDMPEIVKIANKYNLLVLEDCALAVGAKINNKHVGTFGDAGAFSFYPVKHMTTAEGGMLITNSTKIAKRVKSARAFCVNRDYSKRKIPGLYDCNGLGFNYRMSELEASLGITQLKKINIFLKQRKKNFFKLKKIFENSTSFHIPDVYKKSFVSSYYCFSAVFKNISRSKRNELINKINLKGIGTSIYYPHPVPRLNYYKKKYKINPESYKNASIYSDKNICLPVGPHISLNKMSYMVKELKKIIKSL